MLELKPTKEIKKTPELGYDLFDLEAQESELLRGRIEKWKGLVRIFVHPMFEKWRFPREKYLSFSGVEELIKIENFLARILAMPEDKTIALGLA